MLKKILITSAVIITLVVSIGGAGIYWLFSLVPEDTNMSQLEATTADQLPYLEQALPQNRGKILAVITSTDKMGDSGKSTGYELTELARAYWVFTANGFEVDIASPQGGKSPVVLDDDDMAHYDYAFLNDAATQAKVNNTLKIADVDAYAYQAVYFVGGKGAMFDFPDNVAIQELVKVMHSNNKVISAVCHGPAALVNVKLDNGEWLVNNANVSAFTNDEELFLIPDAEQVFPFLLQDKLTERGANFVSGTTYLDQVSQDKNLITGQNPWSVWTLSENVIQALGYTPIARTITPEEHSVALLLAYEQQGYSYAKNIAAKHKAEYQTLLIVMHGIISFMKMELAKGFELLLLADSVAPNE